MSTGAGRVGRRIITTGAIGVALLGSVSRLLLLKSAQLVSQVAAKLAQSGWAMVID